MTEKLTLRPEQEEAVQRIVDPEIRKFQEEDAARIVANATGGSLDTSPPGTSGKTWVAVRAILDLWVDHVLIIGLRDTFGQWVKEFKDQGATEPLRRINATKAGQQAMADYLAGVRGFYYIGWQYLAKKDHENVPLFNSDGSPRMKNGKQLTRSVRLKTWDHVQPEMIVVDEHHLLARRHNASSNTLKALWAPRRHSLTGTPYGNDFENFHGVSSWLWPSVVEKSFPIWKRDWCATKDQYIPGGRAIQKTTGEKYPGKFVQTLPLVLSRVGGTPDLPKPIRVTVELTDEQRRIYDSLEGDLLAWVKDHPWSIDWPVTLKNHLITVTMAEPSVRTREVLQYGATEPRIETEIWFEPDAPSAKLDAVFNLMRGELAGEPILHLTHSKKYAKLAAARMAAAGFRVAEYTGDTTAAERQRVREGFINGDIDHIMATVQTVGTGLDGLQTRCRTIIWHSKVDGSPTVYEQGARRVYRPGGDLENFRMYEILAKDTHDAGVYANVDLARAAMKQSLRRTA